MSPHTHTDRPAIADGESTRVQLFRWLFAVPRFLYKLWYGIAFYLVLLVTYPLFRRLLRDPSGYPSAFRWMRRFAKVLQWLTLTPLRARWVGELPRPPYVICCNHGSYLDIPHLYVLLPEYFVLMGKYELLKWPLFNIFLRDMNIAVNRGSHTEAARALQKAGRALARGTSVALFPEGTIPRTAPRMKHFKDGAFKMAIQHQVPIVPVTFVDNWRIFGDPEDLLSRGHPGFTHAVVHPPIPTAGLTEADLVALRMRVFNVVEGPLLEAEQRRHRR
ncbi:MAG: 1-acyl-sn-glycerol-3-phosphate acyltransferase [Flavobacteriales bacterium]|nr:1-acyl-sn-glycerol-3-phosphate acyltransferase [Flavobacteriales bacterium]